MKYICALIVVEDIEKSRYLYETVLKQKVKADYGKNLSFHGDFAIHKKDHFSTLIDGQKIIQKSNSCELYFEDDEIERTEVLIKENGLQFIHEMREQPWRQRVIRFYDYDGNIIEIGESLEFVAYRLYLEKKSIEEISKIIYLSVDAINGAIEKYSKYQ